MKDRTTATMATVDAVPRIAPYASGQGSFEPSSASWQVPRANSVFRKVRAVLTKACGTGRGQPAVPSARPKERVNARNWCQ